MIILVSIHPEPLSVSLLSIPRDLYVWIPGEGFNRINTAFNYGRWHNYPGGGPALLKDTIEYNLGVPVHYYAQVGFDGFRRVVDALGGVDVAVECPLSDTFPDPESPEGHTDVDWEPGIHHLDGKHALWYARSRWSTTDFDRNRRQQQVLRGLYRQALSLNVLPKIPELWSVLQQNVNTDLTLDQMLYLANLGSRLDTSNVKSGFIGQGVVQAWYGPNGAYVLVPYREAMWQLIEQALAPPASARAQQEPFRVEVWNATHEGLGHVAAERLRWEGLVVTEVRRADGEYARTQIVDYTTSSKGSPIYLLMRLYGRNYADVISEPSEDREIDFRVILGQDYDPCLATRLYWRSETLPTPTPLPTLSPTPTFTPMPTPTP